MHRRSAWTLQIAGLMAAAGIGCAGTQHPTPSEQAQQNLNQAQQNLAKAGDAEKEAAAEQKNVAAAHEQTLKAQQELTAAQRKEDAEAAKVQQLQQQARERTQAANQQAEHVASTLGGQSTNAQRTISGHVLQARPNQLVLQGRDGQMMTLDINDRTRVLIGDQQRSAGELQQGADARVAYEDAGGRPTAVTIEVPRAGAQSGAASAQPLPAQQPPPAPQAAPPRAPQAEPPPPASGPHAVPLPGPDTTQRSGSY